MKGRPEIDLIRAEPLTELAEALREEARVLRDLGADETRALLVERIAARIDQAVELATVGEWLSIERATSALNLEPDTLRAQCRRRWHRSGLARKVGGRRQVHARAISIPLARQETAP